MYKSSKYSLWARCTGTEGVKKWECHYVSSCIYLYLSIYRIFKFGSCFGGVFSNEGKCLEDFCEIYNFGPLQGIDRGTWTHQCPLWTTNTGWLHFAQCSWLSRVSQPLNYLMGRKFLIYNWDCLVLKDFSICYINFCEGLGCWF